jgi:hypothetical protein
MAKTQRKIMLFFILFCGFCLISFSQEKDMVFLKKNDTLIVPYSEAALLQKDVFIRYHLSKTAFDSIKNSLPELAEKLEKLATLEQQKSITLEEMIKKQDELIDKKDEIIEQLDKKIKESTSLNDECIKRAEKASRYRYQRNIFMGTSSLLLVSTLVLMIVVL